MTTTNLLCLPQQCPICRSSEDVEVYRANDDGLIGLVCKECGRSYLTFRIFERLNDLPPSDIFLHRIASHIRKENLTSRYPQIDDAEWTKLRSLLGAQGPSTATTGSAGETPSAGSGDDHSHRSSVVKADPAPLAPEDSWLKIYWLQLVLAVVVYALLGAAFFYISKTPDQWFDFTTGYLLFINLLVLWWYAHTTKRLAETGQKQVEAAQNQYALGLTLRRESNKPFVVLERIIDRDKPGYANYAIRNVGPGVAVNVFVGTPAPGTQDKQNRAGTYRVDSLGALGSGGISILPDRLDRLLCEEQGRSSGVVLIAEGIDTRTDKWTCTLNALTPGGEVLCKIKWPKSYPKTVYELLDSEWTRFGLAQLELREDAKRRG